MALICQLLEHYFQIESIDERTLSFPKCFMLLYGLDRYQCIRYGNVWLAHNIAIKMLVSLEGMGTYSRDWCDSRTGNCSFRDI